MHANNSRIPVACLHMLKMLLIAPNYLKNHINSRYSLVSSLGTTKVLNQGFYCNKHLKRAQNMYVKTRNLSAHHFKSCFLLNENALQFMHIPSILQSIIVHVKWTILRS